VREEVTKRVTRVEATCYDLGFEFKQKTYSCIEKYKKTQ